MQKASAVFRSQNTFFNQKNNICMAFNIVTMTSDIDESYNIYYIILYKIVDINAYVC